MDDALAIVITFSTPREITLLTTFAPNGVFEERIQEPLQLQQANLEETMERRFLVECLVTKLLIKNTSESSLKFFNDFVLCNMNLMMQQGFLHPSNTSFHLHHHQPLSCNLTLRFYHQCFLHQRLQYLLILCLRLHLHHQSHHHLSLNLHPLKG
ncbi:hypothetical protein AAZX31_04G137100 [Glycine max]